MGTCVTTLCIQDFYICQKPIHISHKACPKTRVTSLWWALPMMKGQAAAQNLKVTASQDRQREAYRYNEFLHFIWNPLVRWRRTKVIATVRTCWQTLEEILPPNRLVSHFYQEPKWKSLPYLLHYTVSDDLVAMSTEFIWLYTTAQTRPSYSSEKLVSVLQIESTNIKTNSMEKQKRKNRLHM